MTDSIFLETPEERGVRPGDTVEVTAQWSLSQVPSRFEARLFWFTEGKGTQDVAVVETLPLTGDLLGKQRVRFRIPVGPYSFSGRLITLKWAIEVVADDRAERWELVVGPEAKEVVLATVPGPAVGSREARLNARMRRS